MATSADRPSESSGLGAFLVERGRHVSVGPGEFVFHEGDRSVSVYACVEGRIGILVTLPSGRELVLGMKLPGQEFGELSSIDERPRSAAARAVEPSVVATMGGADFLAALRDRPDLALGVLRNLSQQLRGANVRLSARNADRTAVRVGGRLLELADLHRRHAGSVEVELPITQTELANWIGATRESTARVLADLRAAGALRTGRGRITILDADLLEETVRAS